MVSYIAVAMYQHLFSCEIAFFHGLIMARARVKLALVLDSIGLGLGPCPTMLVIIWYVLFDSDSV